MSEKAAILFQLGPASHHRDWPDYLQYGFDTSDVPDLLELVADESLHLAGVESDEVWVPLHAWRTLGQLQAPMAVAPLIALFDDLYSDDWALSELSRVIGMIGEPAIELLATYMTESGHAEFARVMAFDSLAKVAEYHPHCRERIVGIFRDYMACPDISMATLNGLLMAQLLDLKAVELIDDIRRLFEMGCVDISCAGDLEEVEIELGLRSERTTPKPNYAEQHGVHPGQPERNDDLYAMVDDYFDRYGNDESVLDASELDGYFAALACAPDTLLPSQWMPALWGGEQLSPEWETMDEVKEFTRVVMTFYNHVMLGLKDDEFEALFHEREVEGKTYSIVDEWCEGFLRGLRLWGEMDPADMKVLEECLLPIRLFATEQGFEALKSMSNDEVTVEQDKIEPNVRRLYRHFQVHRKPAVTQIVRDTPKAGRNDPCPCGSGKKYKRCCLH